MAEVALQRHDLVRVAPAAWAGLVAGRADLADPPWLAGWAERGWPLMVRRAAPADAAGRIALGLPLPPSAGKRRVAVDLAADEVGAPAPPPTLSIVVDSAPAAWRATILRLMALSPAVRVFGGLAWQALTGLDYLSPTSDLDLLWPLPPARRVEALLTDIVAAEAEAPMRLDGELVRPDGPAVNWRELANGAREVLVKRLAGVAMESRRAFLEGGR
jgi:phosphoribosyl-dephospho-CoA transferase